MTIYQLLKFFLLIWLLLQAIETGLGYGQWLHGEAVAAGTVTLSPKKDLLFAIAVPLFFSVQMEKLKL